MNYKTGIKVSLWGIAIQAVGLLLDILHHLNIGIETPEGLFTWQHSIIFIGFLITSVGVLVTLIFSPKTVSQASANIE